MARTKATKKTKGLYVRYATESQLEEVRRAAKIADLSMNKFLVKVSINAAKIINSKRSEPRPALGEIAGQQLLSDQNSLAK